MAEQSVVNESLAEKRKRDQALLEQMLPLRYQGLIAFPLCPPLAPPSPKKKVDDSRNVMWCLERWWTYRHHGQHLLYPLLPKLLVVHLHLVHAFRWSVRVQEERVPSHLKGLLALQEVTRALEQV